MVQPGLHGRCATRNSRQVVRRAENECRAIAGMPLLGQAWVSGMALFRQSRAALPRARIANQGGPRRLWPRSLDVSLTYAGVAVEYQGCSTPDRSSSSAARPSSNGSEADSWKRSACAANGCPLMAVHPGTTGRCHREGSGRDRGQGGFDNAPSPSTRSPIGHSTVLRDTLAQQGISQMFIRPHCPRTNWRIEAPEPYPRDRMGPRAAVVFEQPPNHGVGRVARQVRPAQAPAASAASHRPNQQRSRSYT